MGFDIGGFGSGGSGGFDPQGSKLNYDLAHGKYGGGGSGGHGRNSGCMWIVVIFSVIYFILTYGFWVFILATFVIAIIGFILYIIIFSVINLSKSKTTSDSVKEKDNIQNNIKPQDMNENTIENKLYDTDKIKPLYLENENKKSWFKLLKERVTQDRLSDPVWENGYYLDFFHLAGTSYISDIEKAIKEIHTGDKLFLIREPDNAYDNYAIKVLTSCGTHLGYIPKRKNISLANLIDSGENLFARLYSYKHSLNYLSITIEVFIEKN